VYLARSRRGGGPCLESAIHLPPLILNVVSPGSGPGEFELTGDDVQIRLRTLTEFRTVFGGFSLLTDAVPGRKSLLLVQRVLGALELAVASSTWARATSDSP